MRAGQVVLTRECLDCASGGSSDDKVSSGDSGTTIAGPFAQPKAPVIDATADKPLPSAQPTTVVQAAPIGAGNLGVVPIKPPLVEGGVVTYPTWAPWVLVALIVLAALGGKK